MREERAGRTAILRLKRNRVQRTKQIIERCLLTVCLIALLALICSNMLLRAKESDHQGTIYYKYYTQIKVEKGDSLWDIAGRYMENSPYETRREYINEVAKINQLADTTIRAGQNLIVTYYDDTYK